MNEMTYVTGICMDFIGGSFSLSAFIIGYFFHKENGEGFNHFIGFFGVLLAGIFSCTIAVLGSAVCALTIGLVYTCLTLLATLCIWLVLTYFVTPIHNAVGDMLS